MYFSEYVRAADGEECRELRDFFQTARLHIYFATWQSDITKTTPGAAFCCLLMQKLLVVRRGQRLGLGDKTTWLLLEKDGGCG